MKRVLRIGIALWLCCTGFSAGAQEGVFSFQPTSTLTPDLKTGVFRLHMQANRPTEVFYELLDPDGVTVADAIFSFRGSLRTPADSIPAIRPWNPETTQTYTLRLTVNGKASLHPICFFREENGLFNGKKIRNKGVQTRNGRHLPAEDFARMKEAGINTLQDSTLTREQCHALGFYLQPGGNFPHWEEVRADTLLLPLKKAYQNISITLEDASTGRCTLHNRHDFVDLSAFTLHYWVERNGKRPFWYFRRKLHFTTPAQADESFRVKLPRMWRKGEYRLFFELRTKGKVAATEEFLLKDTTPREKKQIKGQLRYTEADTQIVIRGARCEWVLDKVHGTVRSWVVKGKSLLNPGTSLSLCEEKPRQVSAGKGPGNCVSVYLAGAGQTQYLTFYPDGGLKITHAGGSVRFTAGDGKVSYFGRPPGGGKHRQEGSPEGLQTETSWLRCKRITALSDSLFSFRTKAGKTCIYYNGNLVLTPKNTKLNDYE